MEPLISIISVNFNQGNVTCDFLLSLQRLNYSNYEVIIVDNGSDHPPQQDLLKINPNIKYIRSQKNLGFAGGNNLGIERASGDYLFFVNNDTVVTPDLLGLLIKIFLDDENIGVISPKIKYYDRPELIQYAGFTDVNPYTGRNKKIGERELDNGQYDIRYETAFAHGAAMMVSKKVIEVVGPMPEEFFLLYEELDWCLKMRHYGFRVYYEGRATIFHKESISIGKESSMKTYYYMRNRILFMRRNFHGLNLSIFYLYMILLVIPTAIVRYTFKFQMKHVKSVVKAIVWHLNYTNPL